MLEQSSSNQVAVTHSKFFYGWVIVAASTLMVTVTYGMMYSFSVFFKPIADYFNWDRAAVSLIYSASVIIRGAISISVGLLADRYGSVKVSVFCGFMLGLGLVLSSQVHTLWQFFITYAVIQAIGLSGAFGIGTAITSRWFTKNRGLALGIVSAGSGLGTFLIVPGTERLINTFNWSQAFIICGIAAGILIIAAAFLLRPAPKFALPMDENPLAVRAGNNAMPPPTDMNLGLALKDSRILLFMGASVLFFFGIQMILLHLVNYATDMGISPLVAASLISIVGAASIAGRLSTGVGADKIGLYSTLILTRVFLIVSFICLILTRSLWSFYLFAVLFGIPYGGEIPQIPLFVGKYWGTKSMAALVGLILFVISIGGALGAWVTGKIFDITQSYQGAFITGALTALASLILILILISKLRDKTG